MDTCGRVEVGARLGHRGHPCSPDANLVRRQQRPLPGPAALARSCRSSLSTWVTGEGLGPKLELLLRPAGCHSLKAYFVRASHSRELPFSESPPWTAWRCPL